MPYTLQQNHPYKLQFVRMLFFNVCGLEISIPVINQTFNPLPKNKLIKLLGMIPNYLDVKPTYIKHLHGLLDCLNRLLVEKQARFAAYDRFQGPAGRVSNNRRTTAHCLKRHNTGILFGWKNKSLRFRISAP